MTAGALSPAPRLAFVTSAEYPDLTPDDRIAAAALEARGAVVVPAVWSDPTVPWDTFDRLLVRSPWDYFLRAGEFAAWLDAREAHGAVLRNSAAVLRWNMAKTYLRELERRGVRIVPTRWVERGADAPLARVLAAAAWPRAVVKPVVSASAHDTWIVAGTPTAEDEARFRAVTARCGAMVQRYMDGIEGEGEWSLVHLGGRFSHAAIKRPARGDFRVQEEHGGTLERAEAPAWLRAEADRVVAAAPPGLLYARIDGVVAEGAFHLMELELFEPALFFGTDAGAAGRFAGAVLAEGSA